jgi:hypothetical protein
MKMTNITSVFDQDGNELGLYDLAEFFLYLYSKEVFVNDLKPIIKIREGYEELLRIRDDAKIKKEYSKERKE